MPERLVLPAGQSRLVLLRWLGLFAAGVTLLGALAGVLWFRVVPLTIYQVTADGNATTTERGLAGYVAGDAWFAAIGLVLGIGCGIVAWRWFAPLGWPMVPLALVGATWMGGLCWLVGWLLGPGPLPERVQAASTGDSLPIELTVRGPAALVAWPLGAALVIMLIAALVRDPELVQESTDADH